jgi:hypothetical protein
VVEEASQASELSSTPEGVSRRDRHAPLNGIELKGGQPIGS